jgi:hypothetical protein
MVMVITKENIRAAFLVQKAFSAVNIIYEKRL